MSDKIQAAVRGIKAIDSEIVQWENRLEFVKNETERLTKTRDALQAEIDKKTADYQIYLSQKDVESKKIQQDALDGQTQLAKDKAEFQNILKAFQKERQDFLGQKQEVDAQALQAKAKLDNIQQFIMAVQRAISVLGL